MGTLIPQGVPKKFKSLICLEKRAGYIS